MWSLAFTQPNLQLLPSACIFHLCNSLPRSCVVLLGEVNKTGHPTVAMRNAREGRCKSHPGTKSEAVKTATRLPMGGGPYAPIVYLLLVIGHLGLPNTQRTRIINDSTRSHALNPRLPPIRYAQQHRIWTEHRCLAACNKCKRIPRSKGVKVRALFTSAPVTLETDSIQVWTLEDSVRASTRWSGEYEGLLWRPFPSKAIPTCLRFLTCVAEI